MNNEKIAIIGAGLSGTLLAITMAQRGYDVVVYEKRDDMRKVSMSAGRSINLALSPRGMLGLDLAGIRQEIMGQCIPMPGRMVHPLAQEAFFQSYSGRKGEAINSVSRGGLNISLLNKAETFPNLKMHFNHTCTHVVLEKGVAHFKHEKTGMAIETKADIIIGTDGSGSALRKSMMEKTADLLFNYSQHFLSHGYKELSINPSDKGGFKLEKHALHIWPRGSFMIIALPNLDGSFTVTMFHPYEGEWGFNQLTTRERVEEFFQQFYPELIAFMPDYVDEFFNNPTGNLGTVKCFPWQAYGKALLMGDAAHAIVPFYGQGMNASFEDVRVFNELLDENAGNWEVIFNKFQKSRAENTNAIADLAIDNFYEMRDRVDDADFIMKRKIEMQLEYTYPDYYSKYSLVTFRADVPYARAMAQGRAQDEMLLSWCKGGTPSLNLDEMYTQLMQLANETSYVH
ncbi:MAG: FAD-dependent monooxygenase [Saprospiraceae bacterium]|nr:FAD-dependent monooxygenase [Saprospiraceae bacterium]